ncbi:type II toxin-antitoxin system HipA family toxin YjjJ [Janthinobacterium sp. J1-1]|uniref:type II toxin-antitoxin system HipA family toxin YjjJ n=1 Tax=Janthinobacterium sp. J1-1 TaxID=3065910 RepID=UPI00281276C5|nr:type II toxin-antitoxin system HipA family toxin YjjJ [Janthinobacterium sp. J1-1]
MAKKEHAAELVRLLKQGPATAPALVDALGISQPTLSRLWKTITDGVALGAGRARRYALRRKIAGVPAPVPLFRVDATGQVAPAGQLDTLEGGFHALTNAGETSYRLFQGMPFFLGDLRPQGFLGRMEPGKHPELDLPADILQWTPEQVLKYIARRSEQAAGNLILGNESYARYLAEGPALAQSLLIEQEREKWYPSMAEQAMQGEPPGSSAGGEQPKFTAVLQRAFAPAKIEHVIVKFSPPLDTPGGRRWGDLLLCEHLALEVLASHGIATASTAILEAGKRMFLEVVRFDRNGLMGRLPMATLSALDGDLGMQDKSWSVAAKELARLGQLPNDDVATVEILDLYGALIGNTDRHHGNLAVSWEFDQSYRLLPAYDMLPMLYRPNAHGEVIARQAMPNLGAQLELRHLPHCAGMASQFWSEVLNDADISTAFKNDVARPHLATVQALRRV